MLNVNRALHWGRHLMRHVRSPMRGTPSPPQYQQEHQSAGKGLFLEIYSKTDRKLLSSLVRDFTISLFTKSSDLALRLLRKGLLPEPVRDAISSKIRFCL